MQKAPVDPWDDPSGTRLVGDPVDVVTGRLVERTLCFRLIGPLSLQFYRHYISGHNGLSRGLGFGHAHSYDHRLSFDADGLLLEEPIGLRTGFPVLRADGDAHTARGRTLQRVSLLHYTLARPGEPLIRFEFADPEHAARIARFTFGARAIGFKYGKDGRLTFITHSTGLRIAVEEDNAGRLLSLSGPWDGGSDDRLILSCEYDDAGNCVGMIDALGRRSTYAYDAAHRLTRRTDRRGYSFVFAYDDEGRCISSEGEDGVLAVRLCYVRERSLTEVQKSDGGLWKYHYDAAGVITMIVGPEGDVRRFIKGSDGRIVGEIDPLGVALSYVFDFRGKLIGKRFGTGRVIPVQGGREVPGPPPHRIADRPSQYLFGDLPRVLVEHTGPDTTPAALRRGLTDWQPPLPDTPHIAPFGTLPWYPEPSGGRHYSPFGHLIRQELPGGGVRKWTYDANDSMQVQTDADGVVWQQDRRSWNQLASTTNSMGHMVRYRFVLEDEVCGIIDPGETVTEFAYDREMRLRAVWRGGELRETYHRDGAGNLIEKRDAAGATLLRLTPTSDRLVAERRLASGPVHKLEYDAAGKVVRAETDGALVACEYDASGRRVQDLRNGLGVVHERERTTIFDRIVIEREVTAEDVTLHLPGSGLVRIHRLARGVMCSEFGSGTIDLRQFDVMGRCTASAVRWRGDAGTWLRNWRYSSEGDLQAEEDSRDGRVRYRYDAAHRLVEAESDRGTRATFQYDRSGNLIAQPGLSGVSLGVANRLAAANGERFSYNHRHQVSRREGVQRVADYYYDSRDLMVRVEEGGAVWHADYDAIGRRTRAWQSDEETVFWWDGDRLAAEREPDGQLRAYVYPDLWALTPCAFVDLPSEDAPVSEAQVRYVLSDQRGAPRMVEDAGGAVLWEAQVAPYGSASLPVHNRLSLNLRFPGHYLDLTGLHYNRWRYYDPILGRYLQSDPMGVGGGLNVYAYPSNPLVVVDVLGLTGGQGGACPDEVAPPPSPDEEANKPPRPLTPEEERLWKAVFIEVMSKETVPRNVAEAAMDENGVIAVAQSQGSDVPLPTLLALPDENLVPGGGDPRGKCGMPNAVQHLADEAHGGSLPPGDIPVTNGGLNGGDGTLMYRAPCENCQQMYRDNPQLKPTGLPPGVRSGLPPGAEVPFTPPDSWYDWGGT